MFTNLTPVEWVFVLASLIISLVIHEFMHAYAAHLLGDTTAQDMGRLSLNPLDHIDPFMTVILPIITLLVFHFPVLAAKPVPFNPDRVKFDEFGAAIIAFAGPLSNFVLAFIGALIIGHVRLDPTVGTIVLDFIYLNVVLFVFNLIPIPPLDGSRILYAFAPEALQDFMRSIEPYGLFIVFFLVFVGGLQGILGNSIQFVINLLPGGGII